MINNENPAKKYSLNTFLKNHIIVIPAMQRDYAQGRDNAEAANIRTLFITSILDAVFENKELSLDFTYGDSQNNSDRRFYPIDGQQRLTTLFLVYAYVLVRARQEDDKTSIENLKILHNFRFEERYKAGEYIKELLSCKGDDVRLTMPELWHKSPSAEGLARTYLQISKTFKERKNETSLKAMDYLERLEKITFMEISSNLPDDVFCKMNARGRTLTDFEVFKASVVKKFKDENTGFVDAANKFYEKLFSNYRMKNPEDDIDRRVTKSIMRIIRSWFMFLECHIENSKGKASITCDNLDEYIAFDDYFNSVNKEIAGVNETYAIKALGLFFEFFVEKLPDQLTSLLPSRKPKEINEFDKISPDILSACIAFFGREREWTEYDNLKDWMRFVCNILDNTDNSLERTKLFVSIGMSCDIRKEIGSYQIENAPVLKTQLEEEQRKLNLIKTDERWIEPIIEAENLEILNGRISVLLNIKGATESPDNLRNYYNCLKNLWDSCMTEGKRNGTKFALTLLPYYEEKLPKAGTWIPVKFSNPVYAKDILYNSMPDTFCKYAVNIVEKEAVQKVSKDSPYWIKVLCGVEGENLIKAVCEDNEGFVSTYWGTYPVLWAHFACTWGTYKNVMLSEELNTNICRLLKYKNLFTLNPSNSVENLPQFIRGWYIYLTYKDNETYRLKSFADNPNSIFLAKTENGKEILLKEISIANCNDELIRKIDDIIEETL